MENNPIRDLEYFGQSIWIDFISRELISSGKLKKIIEEDGVSGMTSNPSIFEKAIVESHDYDEAICKLAMSGRNEHKIYQELVIEDIRNSADLFLPVYHKTDAEDGYVCLEVSPRLAHDTAGTIAEARQLWSEINRPNVMIKIPATPEGLPAIQHLISDGINVNITLLFGLPRYRRVAEAYISGLKSRTAKGSSPTRVASVASFFISRIDTLVDTTLSRVSQFESTKSAIASKLQGQVALASAKIAYQIYKEIFNGDRFKELKNLGARPQRLLWASTSTKTPAYSDIRYVEELIGSKTINTLPIETLDAYRDHGHPSDKLDKNVYDAFQKMDNLSALGISIDSISHQLENEGVEKFVRAFDQLIDILEQKQADIMKEPICVP